MLCFGIPSTNSTDSSAFVRVRNKASLYVGSGNVAFPLNLLSIRGLNAQELDSEEVGSVSPWAVRVSGKLAAGGRGQK